MLKKILIFSDTHGKNEQLQKTIKKHSPDIVIHAGDFCCSILEMNKFVDYIVSGNNDSEGEEELIFDICNVKVFLCHGHNHISHMSSCFENEKSLIKKVPSNNIDLIIYGHTHVESVNIINNTLIINPGSITQPRNKSKIPSYAMITIKDGKILEKTFDKIIKYI